MNKNALSTSLLFFLLYLITTPAMAQGKDPQVDTARIMEALRSGNDFGPNHFNYISWQDNLMTPSPDAAKMTRYADTPISYAYGQAQIGIPIYTIKGRQLSLPITLSYDSSGIKPEEVSGIVGLGWSLLAGGVITRTVIGQEDDGNEMWPEIPETATPAEIEYLVTRSKFSDTDTEYDLYSYNFCGHVGSFYYIPFRGIVPTEPTELLISGTGPFTITDKDGTQYKFTRTETSTRYMGSNDPNAPDPGTYGNYTNLITSWHLTEIRSMDGLDVITISYRPLDQFLQQSHSYYRSISFPYRYLGNDTWETNLNGGFDPTPAFVSKQWSFISTHVWNPYVVDTISFNGGSVTFDYGDYTQPNVPLNNGPRRSYPSFLSSITVNEGGQDSVFNWNFARDTTGDYRLLLASVTQRGRNGALIEKWDLDYDSPNTNMFLNSVDIFGYYNGHNNSSKAFLRPYNNTGPFSDNDRSHNSTSAKKLSLTSITTASGSRTRYYYSSNSMATGGVSNLFPNTIEIGLRTSRICVYDLSQGSERLVRERNFTYSQPGITISLYAFQMGAFISTTEYNSWVTGNEGGRWWGPMSPVRTGTIVYNDQSNLPGAPLESARIYYEMVTEDVSDGAESIARTVWEYHGYGAQSIGGGGTPWAPSDSHDDTYTNGNSNFNHFFQRVPTFVPGNGTQSNPTTPLGYHIPEQNRPQLTNPTVITRYKKTANGQFVKVSQTNYYYTSVQDYFQVGLTLSYKVSTNIDNHENTNIYCWSDVDQQQVDRKVIYQRLENRIDREYLDDGTERVSMTTYHYDFSPTGRSSLYSGNNYYTSSSSQVPAMGANLSPRQEVLEIYEGTEPSRTYIRNVIYPDELVGVSGCGWAFSLKNKHYLLPVGEEIITGTSQADKVGRYITWGQVLVSVWANNVIPYVTMLKPSKIEVYRNGANVGPTVTYEAYSLAGLPLGIQEQGQPAKAYVWGYKLRFPIAEVTGASFSQLRSSFGADTLARLDSISMADSLSTAQGDLTFLRNALRGSQPAALTSLRSYKPPYGLSMEEDASGRVLSYDYDWAGRLSAIKDGQGHKKFDYSYHFAEGWNGNPNSIEVKTYTSSGSGNSVRDISYYDGLGRTIQQIAVGAATSGKDLVTPLSPDFLDREDAYIFLPYPVPSSNLGAYRSGALSEQQVFYGSGVKAYAENTYEASTRNRIVSSSLPGFTDITTYPRSGVTFPFTAPLNLTYNASDNTISCNGYHPISRYVMAGNVSPDGSISLSFSDELGTHLEQTRLNTAGYYLGTFSSTYYIRDSTGRVLCVVPPAEAAKLTTSTSNFSAVNCYTYSYDSRDRVIKRQLPGQTAETIAYNQADLPTSRTRVAADGQALEVFITNYDAYNRPVSEQYQYGNHPAVTIAEYWYDSYPSAVPAFSAESGYAQAASSKTHGLKTGECIRSLPANVDPASLSSSNVSEIYRAFYYDEDGNIIQTVEDYGDGKSMRISSLYGFAGNLLKQLERITPGSNQPSHTLEHTYAYDARLRRVSATAQLDNGSPATQTYTYDDLQRVAAINRGAGTETTQYSYTLQDWLSTANSTSWEETLRYQSPSRTATDALPGKAGIITEWTQQQKGTSADGATTAETYAFSYDKAGRLIGSLRYIDTSTSSVNTLTEQSITYDHGGNLLTLNRYDNSSETTPSESLSFSYSGPKRTGWSYDSHGNVTSDPKAGTTVAWNILDMPNAISSGTAGVQRSYLADGTLVQVSDGSTTRLYLGDMVFNQTGSTLSLESAGWDGGRLLPGSGTDKVLYYVTDHLGSVRVVKDGSGNIRQRYDYYPYGSVTRSWTSSSSTDNSEKRFRFGGKEIAGAGLSAISGGADKYLDFGARLYSPGTAMWLSQDPLAKDYYPIGPYVYCAGNPVNLVDPEGKNPIYDEFGCFLGVDNLGLEGKPIYMYRDYFQEGMSHEEAMAHHFPFMVHIYDEHALLKVFSHYMGLSCRPDWDGIVTIEEGVNWALAHPNAKDNPTPDNTLYIDASKLNYGFLSKKSIQEGKINLYNGVNLFLSLFNSNIRNTSYALGRVGIIVKEDGKHFIIDNKDGAVYDWNLGGGFFRNAGILFERARNGLDDRHGFNVVYYGLGKIH